MKKGMKENRIALILAGGMGARLWPISRENYPKQFVEFTEGNSLFQLTVKRCLRVMDSGRVYFITAEQHRFTVYNQIDAISELPRGDKIKLKHNIIFEPCPKNTAPAVMLALRHLETSEKISGDTIVFVFPSDHVIEPESAFRKILVQSIPLADMGKIVVFGVRRDDPCRAYGYIKAGKSILNGFAIDKFVEKPSLTVAKKLVDNGAFVNTGIFCFKKSFFTEELKRLRPELRRLYELPYDALVRKFHEIQGDSIDCAVMEKTRQAVMIKFSLHWSDFGSWDSFLEFHHRAKANLKLGHAEFVDSRRCFAYSKERTVSLVGMDDTIVIDSADALLVVKKNRSDRVRNLTSVLQVKKPDIVKESTTVYRPWGYYSILKEEPGYKVKKIAVYPGKSLSMQKHSRRSEHWNAVEGNANVTIGNKIYRLKRNESIFVPKNTRHKLHNPSGRLLVIIEVQIGSYLGEDDITRYDNYKMEDWL